MKSVRSFHRSKINSQAVRQADSLFSLLWWQEQEDFGGEIKSLLQRISVNVSKVTNILNLIQTPTPGELRTQDNKGHPWYLVWLTVPNFDVTCTLVSLARPHASSVESALLLTPNYQTSRRRQGENSDDLGFDYDFSDATSKAQFLKGRIDNLDCIKK